MKQTELFPQRKVSFHNSQHIRGVELRKEDANAKRQESIILRMFKDGKPRNAWEAYCELQSLGHTMIKDSVKRALTNLVVSDSLVKTKVMTKGEFNKGNFQYQLK